MGDFAITNHEDKTTLTFRMPSVGRIDFVEEINASNETRSFGADFGVGGVVDVTVRSDGLFFRDYDPIVGGAFLAQSSLLSDNILRNRPGSIFLSFDSLMDALLLFWPSTSTRRFPSLVGPYI